jgi:hypothetical protein
MTRKKRAYTDDFDTQYCEAAYYQALKDAPLPIRGVCVMCVLSSFPVFVNAGQAAT